ncbi:MAG: hypothetical protein JL50_13425 [Peptococcaceae bacterium BICA1-7]|nr:MAG: hypothetical protein JL50_13425 [Peptococcaceae bacterium BICA1-7]HBV99543.1 DUF116 domain-containing protein [Desulfotomaculum sp.]
MKVSIPYIQNYVRKRLFLGLLGGSLLLVGLFAFALWYIIFYPGQSLMNQSLVLALVIFLSVTVVLAALGMAGMLLTLLASRRLSFLQGPMRVGVNIFFPIIIGLGKLLKIDVDRIKRSFIEVNNQMVRASLFRLAPEQLLVLVPHCLQNTQCPHKITVEIDNCRRCGKCCIGNLLALRDRWGVRMGVATGGTLARKLIRDYRPRAVVAVACERDLTSGIQDSNPLPVLGVTNERPFGPCQNTFIDTCKVEEALNFFLEREGGR